jgi:anti-sigma B factor antagonist
MLEAAPEAGYEDGRFRIDEDRPSRTVALLVVYGDADLSSAPELRARLRAAIDSGPADVVVDLSEASIVDSTALGVLLSAARRIRERHGEIQVVVGRPEIRRIFEITMLDGVFTLHGTRAEALAAVTEGAR